MTQDSPGSTDFGFQQVPWRDKARRVRGVFDSVADRYDLMNDLMSGGAHRLWKQFMLSLTGLRPGDRPWISLGAPAILPPAWRARSASPGWWCWPTSTPICCAMAATG